MQGLQLLVMVAAAFLPMKLFECKITTTDVRRTGPNGYPIRVHEMFKEKVIGKGPKTSGVWSSWSEWTSCSRSCGGGITQQVRHCVSKPTNTKPKDKFYKKHKRRRRQNKSANHCIGLYKRVRLCNTQDCPTGHDFREEQCSAYDNMMFKGKRHIWKPYLQAIDECALNCKAVGGDFYATLNKTVADGTSCNKPTTSSGKPAPIGTKGVCVDGYCKSVGANGVIGAVEESPEECSTCIKKNCRSISGLYTRPDLPPGYSLVAQIPKGACRVLVQQLKHTKNILALRNANGSYILNGDWQFSNSRIVQGAGAQFTYRKQDASSLETITSAGPLDTPVDIMVFYQQPNPGISYGYSLPVDSRDVPEMIPSPARHTSSDLGVLEPRRLDTNLNSLNQKDEAKTVVHPHRRQRQRRKYAWKITGVSACSKSCGGGIQQTVLTCVREHSQTQVVDRRCAHVEKPTPHPIRCNTQDCPHWGGHWGTCSGSCGQGVQQYLVQCVQETNTGKIAMLPDSGCSQPKPVASSRPCALLPCENVIDNELHQNPDEVSAPAGYGEWITGTWSPCSVSCGTGTRMRSVTCPSGNCHPNNRPMHAEYCESGQCSSSGEVSSWLVSDWSQCSENCGTGVQSRYAVCSASSCDDGKPETSRGCSSDRECGGQWFTGPWNACSDSCDRPAVQKRDVYCVVKLRGQARISVEMTCPASSKPEAERHCDGSCPPVWFAGEWGPCENCPNGAQRREVKCYTGHGHASNGCEMENMPIVKRSCTCPKAAIETKEKFKPSHDEPVDRSCVDRIRNCYLAVQARLCQYPYYTTHCCVSCKRSQQDLVE